MMTIGTHIKTGVLKFHYRFLNAILRVLVRLLYRKFNPKKEYSNILIIRKGNIGDMICSMQAFHSLKQYFGTSRFTLLTTHGGQPSLHFKSMFGQSIFDGIMEFRDYGRKELYRKIKHAEYDLVIELPQDVDTLYSQIRNIIYFRFAGIKTGFGWAITNTLFLRKWQHKLWVFRNEQERLAGILKENTIQVVDLPHIKHDEITRKQMKQLLLAEGFSDESKNIALGIGAKLERKRWPIKNFKVLADYLIGQGFKVIIVGDEQDRKRAAVLQQPNVLNLCGRLTIMETSAALNHCAYTISNDSGPMHLAYASGSPVIALFSARNYVGKWHPPGDGKNVVIREDDVKCAICRDKVCEDNICMQAITPEKVISVFESKMNTVV